ncbi:MAG: hypothetical protein RI967_1567 [Planctomycetota bacterium]
MQNRSRPFLLLSLGAALASAIAAPERGAFATGSAMQDATDMPAAGHGHDEPPIDATSPPRGAGGRRGLPPDWPRAGGYGPASDRRAIEGMVLDGLPGGRDPGRELTEEDLAAVIEVAREISPEWGRGLEERAARNERQLRTALGAGARRLLALVALRERAPKVYEAKIVEFRAQARTERAAEALARLERAAEEGGGGDAAVAASDGEAIAAARAELEAAAAAQVAATLAARRVELDALEARLAQFRADLAEDEAAADDEAAALVEDAKARVRRAGEARPEPRE